MTTEDSVAREGIIGASCSLTGSEVRERLAEWRALRDRAASIERDDGGARLDFAPDVPPAEVARLVELEAECCPFYRFTIEIAASTRRLTVDAGPGGGEAVAALLGLDG